MMSYKHFKVGKTKRFFEGWYLKHDNGAVTVAFIPGIHIDASGTPRAFIQVIAPGLTASVEYDMKDVHIERNRFYVRIGDNEFSSAGIKIDIRTESLTISGALTYGAFTPLSYDIMGPFKPLPMECRHGVLSLRHSLSGTLNFGGAEYGFNDGAGYIETDYGRSFPRSYTWLHAFSDDLTHSVMAAVARIPFLKMSFTGHFAVLLYNGKQHRFATYNGSRIQKNEPERLAFKRFDRTLDLHFHGGTAMPLKAPQNGDMSRIIRESIQTPLTVSFTCGKEQHCFSATRACAEIVFDENRVR